MADDAALSHFADLEQRFAQDGVRGRRLDGVLLDEGLEQLLALLAFGPLFLLRLHLAAQLRTEV